MEIRSKLEQLKPYQLNCNVFDVYSYDGLSMQDLLCQFFTRINECIEISNETIDIVKWLVNEGLAIEVSLKLDQWLQDGTIQDIINDKIFNELNDKIDTSIIKFEEDLKIHKDNVIQSLNNIEVDMLQFEGIKGDGVNDDQPAIQEVIDLYSATGKTLKFPAGTYKCLKPIKLKGIKIKGDFGSPYGSAGTQGTLFEFNGCDGFVHDDTIGNLYITNHIEGISITNVDTAIKHSYQVQSTFKNIHITNCQYGLRVGDPTVIGALFCLYENIYVRRAKKIALVINGENFNNSHTFNRCEFFGTSGARVEVLKGLGALNLTFNDCEFGSSNMGYDEAGRPLGRRGITLINTKQTVFNQCFFENPSASVVLADNSDCILNHCVFGSHKADNLDGDEAVIIGRSTANFIKVNEGYVESDNTKMKYLTQHDGIDGRIFINNPVRLKLPSMMLSKNKNYNVTRSSMVDISAEYDTKLKVRTVGEQEGYTVTRVKSDVTNVDDGVLESLESQTVRTIKQHRVDYHKTVQFNNDVIIKNRLGWQYKLVINDDGVLGIEKL